MSIHKRAKDMGVSDLVDRIEKLEEENRKLKSDFYIIPQKEMKKKSERGSIKYLQEWHGELYVIDDGMGFSVYWKTGQGVEHFLGVFDDYTKALGVIIGFKTGLTFRA